MALNAKPIFNMNHSKNFDPNAASSQDSGVFGLPYTQEDSRLVLVPVPWEVTTSYGGGTSQGPEAIFEASKQVDLFDLEVLKPYEPGIFMRPVDPEILELNEATREQAQQIIELGGDLSQNSELEPTLKSVNAAGERLNAWVKAQIAGILRAGKIPAVVGGDHSTPFGAFQAIAETHGDFGILHFDAHSDTRKAYEGFTWSHASIMYNALDRIPEIKRLVQVGIRDVCEQEIDYVESQNERVHVHFDHALAREKMAGKAWHALCEKIVTPLPEKVWISFDIDGLDPRFCPNTGTPVPGGLDFHEAVYLIAAVVRSGRKIIGFDLNEVAPAADGVNEWDANVGARLLYKLCAWTFASQKLALLR
jgi:agmatinase